MKELIHNAKDTTSESIEQGEPFRSPNMPRLSSGILLFKVACFVSAGGAAKFPERAENSAANRWFDSGEPV
jgi:hypothetical protein